MNYLSRRALSITPYTPGEQPHDKSYIKLNTNENPYPPSPRIDSALKTEDLKLYPDPESLLLKEAVAQREGLEPNQIFCGNGSDEVLAFCFLAFFDPDKEILFPDITYSFYPVYANLFHLSYREIPLQSDFTVAVSDYQRKNAGLILPNPNAPTGIFLSLENIEQLLIQNTDQGIVIIDEAYIEFGGKSAAKLIPQYKNLLVVRTLSKSHGLAGLRVGYALGDATLIEGLNRIKNSFNSYPLDRFAMIGAKIALEDEAYYLQIRTQIIETRETFVNALKTADYHILDSTANFVFVSHPKLSGSQVYQYLKEHKILVRHFSHPRIQEYVRITIGNPEDMDIVAKRLFDLAHAGA